MSSKGTWTAVICLLAVNLYCLEYLFIHPWRTLLSDYPYVLEKPSLYWQDGGGDEWALPLPVLQSKQLLSSTKIKSICPDSGWQKNLIFLGRLKEAVYPIEVNCTGEGHFLVLKKSVEKNYDSCLTVSEMAEVKIVDCH